jgi:hypothetical protein
MSSVVEKPSFPVEPVEPGPAQKRSLRSELSTFANVYTQKSVKNSQSVVISFRVDSIIFNKYHSLSREKKRLIKSVIEKMIEQLADSSISISASVANVNLNINAQVVHQVVERAGVRELRERLRRAEEALKCVMSVLSMYRLCDKRCMESVESCVKGYWR